MAYELNILKSGLSKEYSGKKFQTIFNPKVGVTCNLKGKDRFIILNFNGICIVHISKTIFLNGYLSNCCIQYTKKMYHSI